jgi:hypothetical protein
MRRGRIEGLRGTNPLEELRRRPPVRRTSVSAFQKIWCRNRFPPQPTFRSMREPRRPEGHKIHARSQSHRRCLRFGALFPQRRTADRLTRTDRACRRERAHRDRERRNKSRGPGSVVGLPAAINGTYSVTAKTEVDSELGVLSTARVVELLETVPGFCRIAMRMMSQEVARIRSPIAEHCTPVA